VRHLRQCVRDRAGQLYRQTSAVPRLNQSDSSRTPIAYTVIDAFSRSRSTKSHIPPHGALWDGPAEAMLNMIEVVVHV
jgi:hypothetical protein